MRPPVLRAGDVVMLVSPSGPLRPQRLHRGTGLLTGWGLQVQVGPNAHAYAGYLAGSDEQRLDDLNLALRDATVRAVICTRGGFGAQRIIDGLDLDAVAHDPKLLVGFSDITALQLALWRAHRLASVHGPGAAWVAERTGLASAQSLRKAMMTTAPVVLQARPGEESAPVRVAGRAEGVLLGGNLSLLSSSIGTVDMPDLTGAILLLEEVDEPPYKVDRMLLQLRRAGVLAGLAGVAVGQFTRCADASPTSIVEVLCDHLGSLGVPVLGGLPVGHGQDQLSVPVGVTATIDVATGTLVAEPAVR